MTTGKTTALTRQTFVDKAMSLLLNMLSRLVITFLPRSKRLLISWLLFHMLFPSRKSTALPRRTMLYPHLYPFMAPLPTYVHTQLFCFQLQGGLKFCGAWTICNLGSSLSENGYNTISTKLSMNMNFYLEEERKSQQSVVGSWEEEAAPSSAHLVVLITLSGDAMGKWGQQTVFSWEWVPPNTSGSLYGKTVSHRGRLHFPFRSDCLKHASICPPKF